MKKRNPAFCLLLSFVLVFSFAIQGVCQTESRVLWSFDTDWAFLEDGELPRNMISCAVTRDAAYILFDDGTLQRWEPGEDEPTTVWTMHDNIYFFDEEARESGAAFSLAESAEKGRSMEPELHAQLLKEDAEYQTRLQNSIQYLIAGDEALYALNLYTNRIARFENGAFVFLDPPLDLPEDAGISERFPYSAFVEDQTLYLLLGGDWPSTNVSLESTLLSADLVSGSVKTKAIEGCVALAGLSEDRLLLARHTPDRPGSGIFDLFFLDKASLEILAPFGAPIKVSGGLWGLFGFTYDPSLQRLTYLSNNQVVQRSEDGEERAVAFLQTPTAVQAFTAGVLPGDTYVVCLGEGIVARQMDENFQMPLALTIGGPADVGVIDAFQKEHPEIPVENDSLWSLRDEKALTGLLSGSNTPDLFVVDWDRLPMLVEKGFIQDLSLQSSLAEDVAGMLPTAREALLFDGQLYAYPNQWSASPWWVNLDLFEEVFPGEALPDTWEQFMDLWEAFEALPDMDEEIGFINYSKGERNQIVLLWIEQTLQAQGAASSIVTDRFVSLLTRLSERVLPDLNYGIDATPQEVEALNAFYDRAYLFNTNGILFQDDWNVAQELAGRTQMRPDGTISSFTISADKLSPAPRWAFYPLPAMEDGDARWIPGRMSVYVVNPNSANPEAAYLYLEAAREHMPDETRIVLHLDDNEPVRARTYEENRHAITRSIDDYIASMDDAPEWKAMQDEELERRLAELAYVEKNDWMISPEGIERFRAIQPLVRLPRADLMVPSKDELWRWIWESGGRFFSGGQAAQNMLQEIDRKLTMRRMEAQ